MSPDSRGVTQVWQTPVRQLHRVGTSQASARSSTLRQASPNAVVIPLRAKVTCGPVPGGPGGWCGGGRCCAVSPGLMASSAPNSSVKIRAGSVPSAVSASRMPVMNDAGPQM